MILLWEQSKSTRAKRSTWSHGTQRSLSVSSSHQDPPSVRHRKASRPTGDTASAAPQRTARGVAMPQSSVRRGIAALLGRTRKAEVFPLLGPMGSTIHQQLGLQTWTWLKGVLVWILCRKDSWFSWLLLQPGSGSLVIVIALSRHAAGSRHRCPLQFLPVAHPRDLGAPPGWVMG